MLVIGMTGSIGMGKSTTARLFAEFGVAVTDSDGIVHRLYSGEIVPLIEAAFPGTTAGGQVDRVKLSDAVLGNKEALARLEAIVHPAVRAAQTSFVEVARSSGRRVALLDIPLLFETKAATDLIDVTVVVSASEVIQRQRVLARPGMTEAKLAHILSLQMPDSEKRRRAHAVIDTSRGLDAARHQVGGLMRAFAALPDKARRVIRPERFTVTCDRETH